jgi:replicative DNA helicase
MMAYPELDLRMLAYALADKRMLMAMTSAVSAEYFHRELQVMWELISRCFTRYKEVPTERVLQQVAGQAWDEGLKAISAAVQATEFDISEYPLDLEQFRARHNDYLLRRAGEEIFKNNYSDGRFADLEAANRVMRETVAKVAQINKADVFREGTLAGTADDSWTEYERIEQNPAEAEGIHIGFAEFDRITNGLRQSEVLLIGGQSGTGKSALAMNAAVNAWLNGNRVPEDPDLPMNDFKPGRSLVYFTIEMPFEALRRRLHACVAGVSLYGIRDGTLTAEEKVRYRAALKFMQAYPWQFHIIDIPRGATMQHVESKYLEHCQANPEMPPELVVIDYISLMEPDEEKGSDWLNLGRIAEQFHEFGRVHEVPSISPVQLNRPEKGKQPALRPDQERIARSSMLVDNANIVVTIDKRKDEHLQKDMKVHIIKMRDGEQGVIVLQKRLDMMRLMDDVDWDPADYKEAPDGKGSGEDGQRDVQ